MERLSPEAVADAAQRLGWEQRGDKLAKVVERKDFGGAMELVNTVAQLAEAANHHPDIAISWNKVELTLWTHTAGGVTQADVDMAAAIEGLLGQPDVPLPAGVEAPSFTLPDGDDHQRALADLAASGPVLLVFFKTSCPTCRLAMPVVGELERRYGDAVPVVAVTQTDLATTRRWLGEVGFAGPVLDDERGRFAVSRLYDVQTVPTLVLVEDGRVVGSSEAWDRDRMNGWARELGTRTGRDTAPVSTEDDGRPVFKPG